MYWPYLRSKQNEVLAFRDLAVNLSPLVVPIFKPVTLYAFENRLKSILDSGLRVSVIVNSDQGDPIPQFQEVLRIVGDLISRNPGFVFPALEVSSATDIKDIRVFDSMFNGVQTVFIHRNHLFNEAGIQSQILNVISPVHAFHSGEAPSHIINGFQRNSRVLIRDGFSRQNVNGDYPAQSNFDDLVYNYNSLGFNGFGDCASVGDYYAKGGGNPAHVALHLTEERSKNIICNHFVSSSAPGSSTEDMYWDALGKLMQYVGNPPSQPFNTSGVYDYVNNYVSGSYKALGFPKKCSIKHHVEMIDRIISNGRVAFV